MKRRSITVEYHKAKGFSCELRKRELLRSSCAARCGGLFVILQILITAQYLRRPETGTLVAHLRSGAARRFRAVEETLLYGVAHGNSTGIKRLHSISGLEFHVQYMNQRPYPKYR